MDYQNIKLLHVSCVTLSILGFGLRGLLMLIESPLLQSRSAKVLPHLIDTLLLVSGIALALSIQQYPFTVGWLTAKLIALLAYIVFGSIALKRGKTRHQRITALSISLGIFVYLVMVALTRSATLQLL